MRPLIKHFNNSFLHATSPIAQQAMDEHMVKFKGQHAMKQYMPTKPIKRGFKMWCRNDSATGYLFQFDMYGGKQKSIAGSLGENVKIQLSRSLVGTNVRLFFDNFFTSPALIHKLQQEKNILLWDCSAKQKRHAERFKKKTKTWQEERSTEENLKAYTL